MDKAGSQATLDDFVPLHIGGCDVSDRCDSATIPPVEDDLWGPKVHPISRRLGNEQRREFPWSFRGPRRTDHGGPRVTSHVLQLGQG